MVIQFFAVFLYLYSIYKRQTGITAKTIEARKADNNHKIGKTKKFLEISLFSRLLDTKFKQQDINYSIYILTWLFLFEKKNIFPHKVKKHIFKRSNIKKIATKIRNKWYWHTSNAINWKNSHKKLQYFNSKYNTI